jgi:DNA-binding beta-propeller fold protein YncE
MKSFCLATAATLAVLWWSPPIPAADELEPMKTIQLKGKTGNLDHLVVDVKGDRLFLANKANDTLDIIDLKAGKLIAQKENQTAIQGVAYAPELNRIFVGLGTNGLCNVFDGESYKILKTVNFKDDADNVRYNPKTNLVYVAHAEKSLGVIDAKNYFKKADIKLSAAAESFVLEEKRPRLYLVTPDPSQLLQIDTEKNEVTKTYPIEKGAKGHAIALDEANHRVYIGCRKDQMKEPVVVIFDTEVGKEVGSVAIPGGIDDLHIDLKRKRLFASCGEGFVVVLKPDGDKLEVVQKLATVKDAKTCAYVPETGYLYLGVPRQEGKEGPEIRIFKAKE